MVEIKKENVSLDHPSFLYAEKKGVFPLLHQATINDDEQSNLIDKKYKDIKNQRSVKFVKGCLDNWWDNPKLIPERHLFYNVLDKLKELLNIQGFGEELKTNAKMEVYHIIRYFELSEVYDKQFFKKIWKDAPAEVQANNYLEKNENGTKE